MFRAASTFGHEVSIELFELRARVVAKETLGSRIASDEVELSKGRPNCRKEACSHFGQWLAVQVRGGGTPKA